MLGAEGFCKGYPQRCSQNLWVGLGRSGLPPLARENNRDGILPMKHGQAAVGWNRFWLGSAGAVIQQIGLAVISVVFLPGGCCVSRDHTQVKQGLAGRQGRLCDMCRVETRHMSLLIVRFLSEIGA